MKKIIIFLTVLTMCLCFTSCKEKPEEPVTTTEVSEHFKEIPLAQGLVLTNLSAVSGNFPEDGTDSPIDNMFTAEFRNNSGKALQYAKVKIIAGDLEYYFEITTLPADGRIKVFEKSGQAAPANTENIKIETVNAVFYENGLSVHPEIFQVKFNDGSLYIKNISGKDIDGDITILYKNKYDGIYIGGITYRLKIGGLKAGQETGGYASHVKAEGSEVMDISYGS